MQFQHTWMLWATRWQTAPNLLAWQLQPMYMPQNMLLQC